MMLRFKGSDGVAQRVDHTVCLRQPGVRRDEYLHALEI